MFLFCFVVSCVTVFLILCFFVSIVWCCFARHFWYSLRLCIQVVHVSFSFPQFFPQRVCPHWGVITANVKNRCWIKVYQGAPFGLRRFSCKFLHKIVFVTAVSSTCCSTLSWTLTASLLYAGRMLHARTIAYLKSPYPSGSKFPKLEPSVSLSYWFVPARL